MGDDRGSIKWTGRNARRAAFVPFLIAFLWCGLFFGCTTARVHLNGVYWADQEGTQEVLRFYDDGTVIGVDVIGGRPQRVAQWFNRQHEECSHGEYHVQGRLISFYLENPRGRVLYEGHVEGSLLNLQSSSRITGRQQQKQFKFFDVGEP